jgi:hypothetical protein
LRLEALEDRVTPIIGILVGHPVPLVHVAVNPQPLPPSAYIDFAPVPDGSSLLLQGPGTSQGSVQVQGTVLQSIIPSGTSGGTGGSSLGRGLFAATYSLQGTGSESLTLSGTGSGQSGSLLGTLMLNGQWGGTIQLPGQLAWAFSTTFSELMTLTGSVNEASIGGPIVVGESWMGQVTATQSVRPLNPLGGDMTWTAQDTIVQQGVLQIQSNGALGSATMPTPASVMFAEHDQIDETLHPPGPPTSPPPPITIAAVYDTAGNEVLAAFETGSPSAPIVIGGLANVTDHLSETITYPPPAAGGPGMTQTLNEAVDYSDLFIELQS